MKTKKVETYSKAAQFQVPSELEVTKTIQRRLNEQNESLRQQKLDLISELKFKIEKSEKELKEIQKQELLNARGQKKLLTENSRLIKSLVECTPVVQGCKILAEAPKIFKKLIEETLGIRHCRVEFGIEPSAYITQKSTQSNDISVRQKTSERADSYQTVIEDHLGSQRIIILCSTKTPLKKTQKKQLDKIFDFFGNSLLHLAFKSELKSLQQQWSYIFEALPHPILVVNPEFEILQSNLKSNLQPNLKDPLPEGRCYEVLFNRSTPCINCPLLKRSNDSAKSVKRLEIQSQFGGVFEVSSSIFSETPLSYLHIYEDLTEKILIQEFQFEANKKLELGLYTSTLAHELNNPLTGVVTMSQLIQNETPLEDVKKLAQKIELTSKKLLQPIQDILIFSREPSSEDSMSIDFILKKIRALSSLLGLKPEVIVPKEFLPRLLSPRQFQVLLLALTQAVKSFASDKKRNSSDFKIFIHQNESLNFTYIESPEEPNDQSPINPSPKKLIQFCKHLFEFEGLKVSRPRKLPSSLEFQGDSTVKLAQFSL